MLDVVVLNFMECQVFQTGTIKSKLKINRFCILWLLTLTLYPGKAAKKHSKNRHPILKKKAPIYLFFISYYTQL